MTGGDREEARRRLVHAHLLGERFLYRVPGSEGGAEPEEASPGTVEGPTADAAAGEFDAAAWEDLRREVLACTRCELHRTRTQGVFGSGTPVSRFMVVGEAPGFHEDQQGEAFVGRAGQLLTKILEAIGLNREEVFITNILKSRPPGNADPAPHQVQACLPYLERQIELVRPLVILTLGRHAARTLLGVDGAMAALRGRVFEFRGVPLVATYHPAALLRNPQLKRPTWEDVQLARRVYDERAEP
ncbi:MAG TPA: uracil-DNA glycosylase [Gemmatimonadota bacterium]|nr:uracil-DNA glycosylase [Gemmatimonadota bacterium]